MGAGCYPVSLNARLFFPAFEIQDFYDNSINW
jgi:hypothetical protein